MWRFFFSVLELLYKCYKTETCTVSIRLSPPGETGDVLMFRYVPIEIAKKIQIDYIVSGSLEYIFFEKVWSYNLTEKIVDENGEISIYGIYLDEEIISTLPETSPITNDVIKKKNFFNKTATICNILEFARNIDSIQ
jgi:hypothetical protein